MATTGNNNKSEDKTDRLRYPIIKDGTFDINGGDFVFWDSSAKIVKTVGTDGNAATCVGVAEDTSYKNPFGTKIYESCLSVFKQGVFNMKTTNAETYTHLVALYIGADGQTITTVAGSNIIGYVYLPLGNTITGAAGVTVPVLITPKSPILGI